MANPYFNAEYYLANNPDVKDSGLDPETHYLQFGAKEGRAPTSWFNGAYYLATNPDLEAGGITIETAFAHFQAFGSNEGRSPSPTKSLTDASLSGYAAANPDVAQAFGITDPAYLTSQQKAQLSSHFYQFGVNENRPGDPFVAPVGGTFTLTTGADTGAAFTGTAGNDVYEAPVVMAANGTTLVDTLQSIDSLDGAGGVDTLNAVITATTAATPALKNIESVNLRFAANSATVSLANATGVENITVKDSTAAAGTVGIVAGVGAVANLSVNNQVAGATFNGSTATSLNLGLESIGVAGTPAVVTVTGAAATTLSLNANNAIAQVVGTGNATTLNVAATGTNALTLATGATTATVTGAGSANLVTAFTTLTKLDASKNTGGVTATVDAKAVDVKGGSGKDSVTYTAAVAATAVVDLGAGDDTLTLQAAPLTGATLSGGEGTDTLALAGTDYATVSGYGATDLAKITGFEVLSITDALAAAVDVSKIAGITSFQTVGVANGGTQAVSGLGATTAVIMKGDLGTDDGQLDLALKDATGAADAVSLTLNHTADLIAADTAVTVTVGGLVDVETLNVNATATDTAAATAGSVAYTVSVANTATALQTVNISGDQKVSFTSDAAWVKLGTINASANTAGVTIDAKASTTALAITGTAKADVLVGGTKGDTITTGAGNDIVDYSVAGSVSKIGTGAFDIIADFQANTKADSTTAPTQAGAQADWTGDVLRFDSGAGTAGVKFDIFNSAADATTFLANNKSVVNGITAAFDSTNNNLYVDNTADGVADFFIKLTGVTTLTEAAFVVA